MYRKTFEVTGYTYDAAAYCLDHKPAVPEDDLGIIFLGSEWDCVPTCDVCRDEIDVTVIGKDV